MAKLRKRLGLGLLGALLVFGLVQAQDFYNHDLGTAQVFADLDTTPDVGHAIYFHTFTNAITITDFDGFIESGHELIVLSQAVVTYDCTGAGLNCGAVDITTTTGDMTHWVYDGTGWDLVSYIDQTDDVGSNPVGRPNYTQSFTNQTSVTLAHNLGTKNLLIQCYDGTDILLGMDADIDASDPFDIVVTFASSQSGRCVVNGLQNAAASGAPNYSQSFTGQTSVVLTHGLGTNNLIPVCVDGSENGIGMDWVIAASDPFAITVTFASSQSGRCIVNGLMNAGRFTETFTSQTTVTVTGATHGLGTDDLQVQCYTDDSPQQQVGADITVASGTNNVVITFAVAESGKCVIS